MATRSSSRTRTINIRLDDYQVDPVGGVRISPQRQSQRLRKEQQRRRSQHIPGVQSNADPPAPVLQTGQTRVGMLGSGRAGARRTVRDVPNRAAAAEADLEPQHVQLEPDSRAGSKCGCSRERCPTTV